MNDLVNGCDDETMAAVLMLANDLADIFEDNIIYTEECQDGGSILINEHGMRQLGDMFEQVADPLRAIVFEHLLLELESRDIAYDIDQFQSDDV